MKLDAVFETLDKICRVPVRDIGDLYNRRQLIVPANMIVETHNVKPITSNPSAPRRMREHTQQIYLYDRKKDMEFDFGQV